MIRAATDADLDAIAALGDAYWRTTRATGRYPFDIKACVTFVRSNLDRPAQMMTAVYERDGKIVGAVIGYMHAPWCAPPDWKVAQLLMWTVDEAHRGGMIGIKLLVDFEAWGSQQGAFTYGAGAGLMEGSSGNSVLERRGYQYLETNYFKEVQ